MCHEPQQLSHHPQGDNARVSGSGEVDGPSQGDRRKQCQLVLLPQQVWRQGEEMCITLHVCGKRPGQPSVAMAVGHNKTPLPSRHRGRNKHFSHNVDGQKLALPGNEADGRQREQRLHLWEHSNPLKFNIQHFQWNFTVA